MNLDANPAYAARKRAVLDLVKEYQEYSVAPPAFQSNFHDRQLKQLIAVAIKSTWWRERITAAKLRAAQPFYDRLQKLPVLTRDELQQYGNWMQVWLPGSKLSHYQTFRTSGSTGKPVTLIKYRLGHAHEQLAIQLLDSIWQDRDMSKPFVQLRVNADDVDNDLQQEPFCYITQTGINYSRRLTGINLVEILEFLSEKKVKNFLINPIALNLLAKEQLRTQIPGINVSQILTWGDKLETTTRELAAAAFNAKVCDRYSAEELGYLAIQCPHAEHLHALQFFNYVEILNERNEPCQIGELGRVVVTNWHSYGMPLIRYELGDMAAWGEPCKHNIMLPVLEPTIVRIRDVHLNESGQVALPRLDKTALTKIPAIADFQIAQFTDGVIAVIRTFTELTAAEVQEIKSDLVGVFPGQHRIEVLHGQDIDWLKIWKRKLIVKIDQIMPTEISAAILKPYLIEQSVG